MPLPRRLLAEHEKIIFDLRPHWIAVVPAALWTLAAIVLSILAYNYVYDIDGTYVWWEWGLTLILTAGWLALAVVPFLRWYFTMFVLTSDRLITREGVLAKHSKEIPLERINDVAFSQTVLERVLGAGDLMLESAGERGQTRIANVRRPEQVQLMIYKEAEANNARMMRPPDLAKKEPSIPEQIEMLANLRKQGVLTEEEFQAKKRDLLDKM